MELGATNWTLWLGNADVDGCCSSSHIPARWKRALFTCTTSRSMDKAWELAMKWLQISQNSVEDILQCNLRGLYILIVQKIKHHMNGFFTSHAWPFPVPASRSGRPLQFVSDPVSCGPGGGLSRSPTVCGTDPTNFRPLTTNQLTND